MLDVGVVGIFEVEENIFQKNRAKSLENKKNVVTLQRNSETRAAKVAEI